MRDAISAGDFASAGGVSAVEGVAFEVGQAIPPRVKIPSEVTVVFTFTLSEPSVSNAFLGLHRVFHGLVSLGVECPVVGWEIAESAHFAGRETNVLNWGTT